MQVHSVRNTYHYNQPLNNNKSPNFKANGRAYFTPDGLTMGCISWMFRNDIDWKRLAKYEHTHFIDEPKVNVVIYAASDGSEAYTKAISLIEALSETNKKEANKFFPIICYDLDDNIVQAANSGLINTGTVGISVPAKNTRQLINALFTCFREIIIMKTPAIKINHGTIRVNFDQNTSPEHMPLMSRVL